MTNRMSKFYFGSNSVAIFDRVGSRWNLPYPLKLHLNALTMRTAFQSS